MWNRSLVVNSSGWLSLNLMALFVEMTVGAKVALMTAVGGK